MPSPPDGDPPPGGRGGGGAGAGGEGSLISEGRRGQEDQELRGGPLIEFINWKIGTNFEDVEVER